MAKRTVIIGGPRTGKTTLARELARGRTVHHTDSLVGQVNFRENGQHVAEWFNHPGEWVVEGVTAARALRTWLANNPGKPCDEIVKLAEPHVPQTSQQQIMAKGIATVWKEIEPDLIRRGVKIK